MAQAGEPPASALLDWYDRAGRSLPWRLDPAARAAGARPDPYRVWLSEIMLQQTRVAAAIPYYERFVARWPTVGALASAPVEEVLRSWAGLGYYARARNLHACARDVAGRHGGVFPRSEEELRKLPGVGPYTAAAIAAIAFDIPAAAVDGNVERVMARLHAVREPLAAAKRRLRALAESSTPRERAGDYAQALMDLGATVCVPRAPRCGACPWAQWCEGRRTGLAPALPTRARKAPRPVRRGVAYLLTRADGSLLLERRPSSGLLGGMLGLPGTAWTVGGPSGDEARESEPAAARWRPAGEVEHAFTHFALLLEVRVASLEDGATSSKGAGCGGRLSPTRRCRR